MLGSDSYLEISYSDAFNVIAHYFVGGLSAITTQTYQLASGDYVYKVKFDSGYDKGTDGIIDYQLYIRNPSSGSYTFTITFGLDYYSNSVFSQQTTSYTTTSNPTTITAAIQSQHYPTNDSQLLVIASDSVAVGFDAVLTTSSFSTLSACEDNVGPLVDTCSDSAGTLTSGLLLDPSLLKYSVNSPAAPGFSTISLAIDTDASN